MKLVAAFTLIAVACATPLNAQQLITPSPRGSALQQIDSADQIAAGMKPLDQMRSLLVRLAAVTTTGQIVLLKLGPEKGEALLSSEIDKVVIKYGEDWTHKLSSSYRETLSPEEQAAALTAIAARDQATMMPFMIRAGQVMQAKAEPLLQTAVAEVLQAAFEETMRQKP